MFADIVKAILPVVEKVIPDKGKALDMAHELAVKQMSGDFDMARGQMEINKAEAASRNVWTSGWRPSVGWTCSAAIFINYVGLPVAQMAGYAVGIVPLDLTALWPVLLGMLGLGSLRSIEKVKGVAK